MQTTFHVLSLSFGQIEDNGFNYASVQILEDEVVNNDNFVGQKVAKIRLNADNNNQLARTLKSSGAVPGNVKVKIDLVTRSGKSEPVISGLVQ